MTIKVRPIKIVKIYLLGLCIFFFITTVFASPYYITHPTYFPSKSGSYILFDLSLLPITFNILYRDSQAKWHFDNRWITTSSNVTITVWFKNNWLNYTTDGGTQKIYSGDKPAKVYFDNTEQKEGETWNYNIAQKTVTITPTATNVSLRWGFYTMYDALIRMLPIIALGIGATIVTIIGIGRGIDVRDLLFAIIMFIALIIMVLMLGY